MGQCEEGGRERAFGQQGLGKRNLLGRGPRGSPGAEMGIAGLELGMSKGWRAGELCDRGGKGCIAGQGPGEGL